MKTLERYIDDLSHEREAVRLHAARQIKFFKNQEAIEPLQMVFQRDTVQVKAEALFSVFEINSRQAEKILGSCLDSDNEYLKIAALYCLNQKPFPQFTGKLIKLFKNKKSVQLSFFSAGALALYPEDEEVKKVLLNSLKEEINQNLFLAIARSCAEMGLSEALPEFLKHFLDPARSEICEQLLDCILTLAVLDSRYFFLEYDKLYEVYLKLATPGMGGYFNLESLLKIAGKMANAFKKGKYQQFLRELFSYCFFLVGLQGKHSGRWELTEIQENDFQKVKTILPVSMGMALETIYYLANNFNNEGGKSFIRQQLQLGTAAFYKIIEEMRAVETAAEGNLQKDLKKLANATSIEPRLLIERLSETKETAMNVREIVSRQENVFSMMYGSLILGRQQEMEALPLLFDLLQLNNDMIAQSVIKSITEYKFQEIMPGLNRLLQDNYSNWSQIYACSILTRYRNEHSLEILVGQLQNEEIAIKINIIRDLEEFGDPGAIDVLHPLLDAKEVELVQAVKSALLTLCQGNDVQIPELEKIIAEFSS